MKNFFPLTLLALLLISCSEPEAEIDRFDSFGLEEVTVTQLTEGYLNNDFTVHNVVSAYLDRIENIDKAGPALNSIIQINPDALLIADSLDQELQNGNSRGPFHGIPVVLKDNIDTHDGMYTTAGSRFLDGSTPLRDSFIVEKMRENGAVILGKANLSEWANFHSSFSSSGWSGLGGQTKNPYDTTRNPCGSSAGSGVATSANLTAISIGTETNGSIVCPSGANGVVGLKPTIGLISRSGIIPISYTTDSAGPMTRTVRDAAITLGVLAGVDPEDEKTLQAEEHIHSDYTEFLNADGLERKTNWFLYRSDGQPFPRRYFDA